MSKKNVKINHKYVPNKYTFVCVCISNDEEFDFEESSKSARSSVRVPLW